MDMHVVEILFQCCDLQGSTVPVDPGLNWSDLNTAWSVKGDTAESHQSRVAGHGDGDGGIVMAKVAKR